MRGVIDPIVGGFLLIVTVGIILTAIVAAQPDININNPPATMMPHLPAK